ncbi:class I SAM-dependent methyltransferase [Patescibacteria group bacterium]|nr:class I SAM-dependent methyltransferase [Patescibacteria group bacterium]
MKNKLGHQKKYFNEIAENYHSLSSSSIASAEKLKKATREFIKGNVLDVGSGGIINYDIRNARKLVLSDIAVETLKNPQIIENGKLHTIKNNKISFVEASALSLPFKKNSFDTVIMVTTAHHLSENSLSKTKRNILNAFSEINKVLKKDGIFIIHECFLFPLLKFLQEIFFEPSFWLLFKVGKPLPYFMSERQIVQYLKTAGFRVIKRKSIPSGEKIYLPLFPKLSPPGKIWDKLLKSEVYITKKIR